MKGTPVQARRLKWLATLEAPVTGRDADTGAQVITWLPVASFRVELLESATANEAQADRVEGYARPSRVRTWWRSDITPTHRLNLGAGRLLQILGTAELGFRQGVELACKEWAHE